MFQPAKCAFRALDVAERGEHMALRPGKAALALTMAGALAATCLASQASAQIVPGSPGPPPPREERPDVRPPAAREGENYDPIGVRMGSFRLFPLLELDEGFNDNVFAVPASSGQTASFVQIIKPAL